MKQLITLEEQELNSILRDFYRSFDSGYQFENFLKIYLEAIGLDEVTVTKKSRDGGIDLTAIRKGIGEFSNDLDYIDYYIQAKRYDPENKISIKDIRALRGVMPSGSKGMFITTASFSDSSKDFASKEDYSRPIILVDGKSLMQSCIDREIGFSYKPVLNKDNISSILNKNINNSNDKIINYIEKQITANDIRACILPIPKNIINNIPNNIFQVEISFDSVNFYKYNINKTRRYIGGITQIYRQYGLKTDNMAIPKKSKWNILSNIKFIITFE